MTVTLLEPGSDLTFNLGEVMFRVELRLLESRDKTLSSLSNVLHELTLDSRCCTPEIVLSTLIEENEIKCATAKWCNN